jgi:uncharacterized protein YndB with AHSA1/START domain
VTDEPALEIERRIHATPTEVFRYLTDPDRYKRWMGGSAELDPRPGGTYRVAIADGATARGRYVTVEPPKRVVFTWGWEGNAEVPPESTSVEITLIEDGDETILRLRHSGLPDRAARRLHEQGWAMYLDRLPTVISSDQSSFTAASRRRPSRDT